MVDGMTAISPWIVVGDSPSGAAGLARARDRHVTATTVTTNGAWRHFNGEAPNIYFLVGAATARQYMAEAGRFQKRGTKLVTLERNRRQLTGRGFEFFDEFLPLMSGQERTPRRFVRGAYVEACLSGLFCLQYAVNKGATHVLMAGMEGYSVELNGTRGVKQTKGVIAPFTQELVAVCSDVQFTLYGTPHYALAGSNVEIEGV